jgi:hypothetical protein
VGKEPPPVPGPYLGFDLRPEHEAVFDTIPLHYPVVDAPIGGSRLSYEEQFFMPIPMQEL